MYLDFFALKALPFSISPDPDFLFLSDRHKEALAHLKYGLQSDGGFVLLTGEVGTGKTTICRLLLQQLPDNLDIAFILNPALNEIELLASICDEFNISYPQENISLKLLFDKLSSWMKDNQHHGRKAVVLIDEAQHLSFSVLEQLRLLTNMESNNKKALQVILIGQTELQEKLKKPALRQLAQRITARYHLLTLTEKESEFYIQHRLNVAGASYPIFEPKVFKKIFKHSQGVPRLINLICDRCLLCAYGEHLNKVSPHILKKVLQETELGFRVQEPTHSHFHQWGRFLLLVILILLVGMQLPKILDKPFLSQFFDKEAARSEPPLVLGVADKTVPLIDPAPSVSVETAQQKAPAQLTNNLLDSPSQWFDDSPDLDLTQVQFGDALKTLYAVWGYQVETTGISCEQGRVVSLMCFSVVSNLDKLAQLNYPAVLNFVHGRQNIYAVLYKISDIYQLLIGDQSIQVSKDWLQRYWSGRFTLLWKMPFAVQNELKLGKQGERVTWLAQQLDQVYHRPISHKNRFDLELKEQVKQFQRDHSLIDDGIVGEQTMMLLMQRTHPKFPRLVEELL